MIVRSMRMQECWCSNCTAGQMDKIYDIIFSEKISERALIGRKITCHRCGFDNVIDDVIDIIPSTFLVSSNKEASKYKSNEELLNWLNNDNHEQKI